MNCHQKTYSQIRYLLFLLIFFIDIIGFITFLNLIQIPSGEGNFLFGYTLSRLGILAIISIGSVLVSIGIIWLQRKPNQESLERIISAINCQYTVIILFIICTLLVALIWVIGMAPDYFLGKYNLLLDRLLPLLIWISSIFVSLLILIGYYRNLSQNSGVQFIKKHLLQFFSFLFADLILFFLVMKTYPLLTDQLWFGRYGVPILAIQVVVCWVILTLAIPIWEIFDGKRTNWLRKNSSTILFLIIWIVAAALLVIQPIEFMADMYSTTIEQHTIPLPPNYEIYPRKDSLTYFNLTESIKLGNGLYRSIDKSMFLSFEAINNWLAGGSYEKMLNYQTIVLAILPAILFLLGKRMFNSWSGLMIAALITFQEINAIRLMDEFPLTSTKVLLSEPFMGIWTAVISLLAFNALRNHSKNNSILFLILGASIGFSALFRLNAFVVLPVLLFIYFIKYFNDWKKFVQATLLILVGLVVSLSPWMIHNYIKYDNPIAFISGKVKGVIFEQRIEKTITSEILRTDRTPQLANAIYTGNQINTYPEVSINSGEFNGNMLFSTFVKLESNTHKMAFITDLYEVGKSIIRHFLNNVITSFSVLPVSYRPDDLFHGSRNQKFWGIYDQSLYAGINPLSILFNLIILSLGLFKTFQKNKVAGLIPLGVMTGYHLSNGIAISSGNRYAQPVSWVLLFYYSIGLISLSFSILRILKIINIEEEPHALKANLPSKKNPFILIPIILLIGSLPVLADTLPKSRYFPFESNRLTDLASSGKSDHTFAQVLRSKNVQNFTNNLLQMDYGKALMPIIVDKEKFQQIYGAEFGDDGNFLTFTAILSKAETPQRYIFYLENENVTLNNGSEIVILFDEKTREVFAIGKIDNDFSRKISTYDKDIDQIPLEEILISRNIDEIISSPLLP